MRSLTLAASVLLALMVACVPAPGQEQEHPIATQVKTSLKDPTKPFTLFIQIKVKEGTSGKFEAAFAKAAKETRKEKGNKAYVLHRSAKEPTEYVIYERWLDLAALQAHLKAAYVTSLLAEVGEMLNGAPDVKVFLPTGE
jgi:quinol monooxygenase YgiN